MQVPKTKRGDFLGMKNITTERNVLIKTAKDGPTLVRMSFLTKDKKIPNDLELGTRLNALDTCLRVQVLRKNLSPI